MRPQHEIARVIERYESGRIGRREMFRLLNRMLGGYAATHQIGRAHV